MLKLSKYSIITIITLLFHINAYSKNTRLKLANITVKYYNLLLNKKFNAVNNMMDDPFSINGVINFKKRNESLNFLRRIYTKPHKHIEIIQLSVFKSKDILKYRYKKRFICLKVNFNNIGSDDWIALVLKMKIDGVITNTKSGLIITKKNDQWLIKGMYIQ